MKKIALKTDSILQGDFEIKDLNLLLVFQVNCPGCFIYALPQAVQLDQKYGSQGLNVLALSTAFEDFELNTVENTQLLVQKSELVGETRKYWQAQGVDSYPFSLQFPVAFDRMGSGQNLFGPEDVELIYQSYPQFGQLAEGEQSEIRAKLKQHLVSQPLAAYTFTINQLRGTPSWLLFDSNYNLLREWFGHKSDSEVESILTQFLEQKDPESKKQEVSSLS